MKEKILSSISKAIDQLSAFIANRKGLLPLLGILLILVNFILAAFSSSWITQTNLFLHFGIILAIIGFMLAWAL